MGIVGAIIGDIVGSRFEFNHPDDFDYENCELFTDECKYTDDTVMSIATGMTIVKAIEEDRLNDLSAYDFANMYRKYGIKYPKAGYGDMFDEWIISDDLETNDSYGNGAAMRISPIIDLLAVDYSDESFGKTITKTISSCSITHNHPEAFIGATTTNVCAYMSKFGYKKTDIYEFSKYAYPKEKYIFGVEVPLSDYKDKNLWSATCQNSVPVSISCFLESESYEDFLRKVICMRCDTDTISAIGGNIAGEYYPIKFDTDEIFKRYLDKDLYNDLQKILEMKKWREKETIDR